MPDINLEEVKLSFSGQELLDLVREVYEAHCGEVRHNVSVATEPLEIVLDAHESEGFLRGVFEFCKMLGLPENQFKTLFADYRAFSAGWREVGYERLALEKGAKLM